MVSNHTIHGGNFYHRSERDDGQKISKAVIELFHGLYGMLHRFVGTTCRPHQYDPM